MMKIARRASTLVLVQWIVGGTCTCDNAMTNRVAGRTRTSSSLQHGLSFIGSMNKRNGKRLMGVVTGFGQQEQQCRRRQEQQLPVGGGGRLSTRLQYENDPPQSGGSADQQYFFNAWSVLSDTERWISETLDSCNSGAPTGENPYSRKEVSYVCETNADSPMIVAGIFRRLREQREQGERHGMQEEDRSIDQGENYRPSTFRQTQVVVIPANKAMRDSFQVFDKCINAINAARRNARDYVTDVSLENLDERMYGENEQRDWSVSVNCAHLHPEYGKKTPEQRLLEMKEEEEQGEVDLNLQAYKEKRLLARQSPYPTIVVEVRSVPPPDFGKAGGLDKPSAVEASPALSSSSSSGTDGTDGVTSEDIQRLETLFGKSAHMDPHPSSEGMDENNQKKQQKKKEENDFYASIGDSIQEISSISPMSLGQNWIAQHDPQFVAESSAFTSSNAKHVDEGYEFVFTNVAMQISVGAAAAATDAITQPHRQYLIMPSFLSSSATSLEKFSHEVTNIMRTLPDLNGNIQITTFHPEHIDSHRRSPVPICVLEYSKQTKQE